MGKIKERKVALSDARHKVKNDKNAIRLKLKEIKKRSKCFMCGEDHISCLEFHHVGGKEKEISNMLSKYTEEEILEEINKCVVVCCNCHRKIHYEESIIHARERNTKRFAS